MTIVTIGIDLAKNLFAVHGVDETGKAMLIRPRVPRDQLATLIAQLPACLIGMEACSGAHHWARMFQQHGHTVKLMAPNAAVPYFRASLRVRSVMLPSFLSSPVKTSHCGRVRRLSRWRSIFLDVTRG